MGKKHTVSTAFCVQALVLAHCWHASDVLLAGVQVRSMAWLCKSTYSNMQTPCKASNLSPKVQLLPCGWVTAFQL